MESEESEPNTSACLLPFTLVAGPQGGVDVSFATDRELCSYAQGLPTLRSDTEARFELERQFLHQRLNGCAGDIAQSGYVFSSTWENPNLWNEPFAPSTVLEVHLPDDAQQSLAEPSFEEVDISSIEDSASAPGSILRKATAAQGTREYVRGSLASTPFTPGGEAVQAASTAATKAAKEAATGAWLAQLEAPVPPRVLAPGMPHGAFGSWAQSGRGEAEALDEDASSPLAKAALSMVSIPDRITQNGATTGPSDRPATLAIGDLFKGVWLADDDPQGSEAGNTSGSEEVQEEEEESKIFAEAPRVADLQLLDSADLPGAQDDPAADQLLLSPTPKAGFPSPGVAPPTALASPAKKRGPADAEWAVRGGIAHVSTTFNQLRPSLAMTHPFELDTFQKEAVIHLEQGHSVFVAAHTSAGKTVVAEYAFALARQHCTRAIYTSPIKTISNQKYRDFSSQFEVGLLTGDVSIKPEAPCLIMTTEVLRSMLYKGADIIRDIEWVVFDEVHYVNDAERGVVWEEVIIMLPAHVNLVLLSATVPNVMEFANWVGRTKRKLMYVTGTTRRPVPLEHNLYFEGQLYTIARQDVFLTEGIGAAKKAWKAKNAPAPLTKADAKAARPTGRGDGRGGSQGGGRGGAPARSGPGRLARGGASNASHARAIADATGGRKGRLPSDRTFWMGLVKLLDQKQLLPAVVFCFSKKKVDMLADMLPNMDFTTASEKSKIHLFFDKSVSRLKGTDRELPQILRLREMLRRGLGMHHAGLLPIMKEVVEMLFCQGVIKVLFSTETFAMGVNAPARTVIFQGLRKHDGKSFRNLLSGEYTQMAGRAGRRGLDPVGTVIIVCMTDIPEEGEIRTLLTGKATKLESRFRLTYTMILNLLRVEDLKVEDMLKRSFAEFHAQRAQPETQVALEKGQAALAAVRARPFPEAFMGTTKADVHEFHDITSAINELSEEVQAKIMASRSAQQALVPGRLVLVTDNVSRLQQLAMICGSAPSTTGRSLLLGSSSSPGSAGGYYVLMLHRSSPLDDCASNDKDANPSAAHDSYLGPGLSLKASGKRAPIGPGPLPRRGSVGGVEYILREVEAADIEEICRAKLKIESEEILDPDDSQTLTAAVRQLQRAAEAAADDGGAPLTLDPESDLKINQYDLVQAIRERRRLMQIRAAMPCQREPAFGEMWALVHSEALLEGRLKRLAHQLSDANLQQMPEFHQRTEVLRQLEYVAPDNTVLMKGRVACEVNAGDELVTTEIIFAGLLSELSPEEAVALLSALVFQEKSEMEGAAAPNERLEGARQHMQALATHAGEVQRDCGLDIVPEEFSREVLKFGLLEVVYLWAKGTPFEEISKLTDVMEGSIVRCVVRLDELCRQLRDAARVMGNTALFQQMEAASAAVKRDVVFAASLYTT